MSLTLRYPGAAIAADTARALAGLAACGAMMLYLPTDSWGFALAVPLVILFGGFALLTTHRARLRIVATPDALVIHPGARCLSWSRLNEFKLDYYSTRRDREGGWMQLKLVDALGARVSVDSRLLGFEQLVTMALAAASRNDLTLAPSTLTNVRALDDRAAP